MDCFRNHGPRVPDTAFDAGRLEAIIFDLDGTLYRQNSLRRAMSLRLVRAHVSQPLVGLRTLRVLAAYRRAQERLRESASTSTEPVDMAEAQIRLTCERTGVEPAFITACLARWSDH